MGLGRFELPTSPLSGARSNQLSYKPNSEKRLEASLPADALSKLNSAPHDLRPTWKSTDCDRRGRSIPSASSGTFPRKEVIQPQVLLQLPCYDFTPIIDHTIGACPPCGLAQRLQVQPTFVM